MIQDRGGGAIDTWVEPCPRCGADVEIPADAHRVSCSRCRKRFRPDGRPTVVGAPAAPRVLPQTRDGLVGTVLGRWTLTRLIGRGGMGRVYEARDERGKRRVAVKVLREDLAADPSFVRRFHREAKLLASLSHPHVVEVLEEGEHDGRLWFAMGYVRGESLRRHMERGPIEPRAAARIAAEVAAALAYAHDRGVVHRDLKPENVLLDEQGSVHLVDFGLSRLVDAGPGEASTRLTRTDVILGTYEYMAPEQRRGERDLDGRADVFALGVILYEMLTGTLPLGRFTPPSDLVRAVPAAFDDVVNRALATERKDRFATATAFQEAVTRAFRARPAPPALPAAPASLPDAAPTAADVQDARRIMRHVEILAALDRVGGAVLMLGALGAFSVFPFLMPFGWVVSFGGVIAFFLGLYLWGLGRRVSMLQPGARHSQVTASVILLFFPPFLTALGIYGLLVMTSERAIRAFRLGRGVLGDEKVHPIFVRHAVEVERPPRPAPASLLMRAFLLLAILWSVYACVQAIEVGGTVGLSGHELALTRQLHVQTVAGAIIAFVVMVRAYTLRKRRRGLGLAVTAFLFLYGSAAALSLAIDNAQPHSLPAERGAAVWTDPRPPYAFRTVLRTPHRER